MNDKDLQHLAAIVRDSDDAIIGKTLDGIITSWNRGAQRIYGYSAEDAIERTVAMLVPPDREDELPEILRKLTQGEGINHYDTLRVTKEGRLVNISLTVSPIRDASGAIIGASSIGRDVTKEKEAEAALRESATAYKLLMEQASDAILVNYPDQPLIEVNQRASDMLGYSREELIQLSRTGEGRILPEGVSELPLREDEMLGGDIVCAERPVLRKDGQVMIIEISTRRLEDGRIMTTARDITVRKRSEAALRESQARLRSAIDLAELWVYEWNPQTDVLIWDMRLKEIWGLSPDASVNNEIFLASVHPDDRESVEAEKNRSIDPAGDGLYIAEFRVIGQQGQQERWIASRGKTFFEGDVAVRHFGVAQDITQRKQAKEALAKSEAELRALFGAMTDVVMVLDAQGRYLQIAPTSPDLLYKPPAELLGQTLHEVLPTVDADNILNHIQLALEKQQPVHVEYSLPIGDSEVWFDGTVSPMGEDKVFWIARDVTKRKNAEENLRLSSEILQRVRSLVLVSDKNGQITYVSPSVKTLLGYEPDELLGDGWWQVSKLDVDEAERERARILNFAARATADPSVNVEPYERMVKDKAGELHWILWQDAKGPGDLVIGVGHDITERKRAEEALRASEEKFHAIFDNTLDAVFITGDGGKFVDVNPAACKLLGLCAEELQGRTYTEFQNLKSTTELERLQDQIVERGEASGDLQFVSATGEIKDVEYFSKANFIPGYHLSVVHDHTERRRGEEARMARDEAERANRAKSEFLSLMSHELRTPLNSILGFTELLEMGDPTSEQREYLKYVSKAGSHLLILINEILDIARIEAGREALSLEPVDVEEVLDECLELIQPMLAQLSLSTHAEKTVTRGRHVLADRHRIKQVLLNLLANAAKYNREGGKITVSCEEQGNSLRIWIQDSGPGISQEMLPKLFTPFERLDADQREIQGTGLGLALSKQLMGAMGGKIGVESTVGTGSSFWIELALAEAPVEAIRHPITGPISLNLLDSEMKTVLYIEDNLPNVKLVEAVMAQVGSITLITAMQGGLGLDIARQQRPDLIMLHMHLPDMTGEEVLRQLQLDPETSNVPVVMISADATPHHMERMLRAGAFDYLTKPLSVKRLIRLLEEVLQ